MSVVYNPPKPHECDLPRPGVLRTGAIARCAECRGYSQLQARQFGSGQRWWRGLDAFTVLGYMWLGRIPARKETSR